MKNPGSRYTQMLQPVQPQINNGTVTGGLAYALQNGLRAYAGMRAEDAAKDKQEQQQSRMADMLRGMNRGAMMPRDESGAMGPTVEAAEAAKFANPDGLAAALMSDNPVMQKIALSQYQAATAPPEKPEAYTLSPGQARYRGDEMIANVPAKPPSAREMAFGSLTPEEQRKAVMGGGTRVNVKLPAQQGEEQKARGKMLVGQFEAVQEAANNSRNQLAYLEQARQINETPTGEGLPVIGALKQKAGAIISALGFDPAAVPGFEDIADAQKFNGVVQNMVLAKMQAQKGPQTENDAKRIEETVASLGQSPEARTFLLDSATAMARMDVMRAEHWQQHWQENGTYDGAGTSWAQGLGGQRMVARNSASGRTVFLPDFIDAVSQQNPEASMSEILELWSSYE